MNTLWASLIGLILIALIVVIAFNFLQSRQGRMRGLQRDRVAGGEVPPARATKTAAGPAPGPDAQPPGARIEPTFGDGPDSPAMRIDEPVGASLSSERPDHAVNAEPRSRPIDDDGNRTAPAGSSADPQQPGRGEAAPPPDAAAASTVVPSVPMPARRDDVSSRPRLDPRLDSIVELSPGPPISGERLVTLGGSLRRAGSKPLLLEAESDDGRWQPPQSGQSYRRVRLGVLLANRHGPLNALEYSEFGNAVQTLGKQLGEQPALPEMTPVLEHARELDEACMQLDAQIGLNVETPTALSPGELAALAAGLDMVERGNNRFARLGDTGDVLFSLSLGDRANLLTLLLDVPRAPPQERPWSLMLESAQECAQRSGGRLVDDEGRQLTEAAAAAVTRQLEQRYRSLDDAGLTAGSPAALRVFN
jgi:hypothetical protein